MAINYINARIKNKRDTASNFESNNPILLNGEIVVIDDDTGNLRLKIGDGVNTYSSLPVFNLVPDIGTDNNGKVLSIVDGNITWSQSYNIKSITQSEYDALTEKDNNTLYVIEV